VEYDIIQKYNNKYNTTEKIEENYKKFNEEELIHYLKGILSKKNSYL